MEVIFVNGPPNSTSGVPPPLVLLRPLDAAGIMVLAAAQVGVPAPVDVSTSPGFPAPDICILLASLYTIPPFTAVSAALLPPLASGSMPVTFVVRSIVPLVISLFKIGPHAGVVPPCQTSLRCPTPGATIPGSVPVFCNTEIVSNNPPLPIPTSIGERPKIVGIAAD